MKQRLAALFKRQPSAPSTSSEADHLAWWEKLPLALATASQSVVVGLWFYRYTDLGYDALNVVIGVVAGLALDAIVVTTIMGRRVGRDSAWSTSASVGALLCSALIAIDSYSDWLASARPLLHVSYPLMVFLYSQHLAGSKRAVVQVPTIPGAPMEQTQAIDRALLSDLLAPVQEPSGQAFIRSAIGSAVETTMRNGHVPQEATATRALDDLVTVAQPRTAFACPKCKAPLASKQALGAAVRNKHCPACKGAS
jgi:hypothetical protein